MAFAQHGDTNAAQSTKNLQVAPGLKVDIFASEPLLQNPVAFTIDEKGRFFIAETHRYKDSIFDIWAADKRWKMADFGFRTVEDRAGFLAKEFATNINFLTKDSELIRLVEDRDGDGRAETSSIFADGFNETTAGTAAGILASKGNIWFTCIPDLWKFSYDFKATNNIAAASRQKLLTNFGVHIGVSGHDLHGVVMGPDGKIYFSIGDRGFNPPPDIHGFGFTTKFLREVLPHCGAVYRCNPDGSNFEVFAIGLRNPQEIAFDEFGNLFAHDNDTAGEDEPRVLYVVEGGDYGWRSAYQFMTGFGPWVQENVWKGNIDDVLPTCGKGAQGPSGLAYYPGTGLPEKYRNHFFACDFPQGVWSFEMKPKGASFEVADKEKFLWNLGPTDVAFGPDCNVYISDWGKSYQMPDAGKIFRVFDPQQQNSAAANEVKKLLGEEMENRSLDELTKLLGHADLRVKTEARFELEKRTGKKSVAKRFNLNDADPHNRLLAAIAIGKAADKKSVPAILAMLRQNNDSDTYLRGAGVAALVNIGDFAAIQKAATNESFAVRHAALLCMRRLQSPEIAQFLNIHPPKDDSSGKLAIEAARAINDAPIPEAMPRLAALLGVATFTSRSEVGLSRFPALRSEQLIRRTINANFRLGGTTNAEALADFALYSVDVNDAMHVEALEALGDWAEPHPMDRVVGMWRPLPKRNPQPARDALSKNFEKGLEAHKEKVVVALISTAGKLRMTNTAPALLGLFSKKETLPAVRIAIIDALAAMNSEQLGKAIEVSLADADVNVRGEAIKFIESANPASAAGLLGKLLATETDLRISQTIYAALGGLKDSAADKILLHQLDELLAGKIKPELHLDLIEAAEKRTAPEIKNRLAKFQNKKSAGEELATFRICLSGGDADAGKRIFAENDAVGCLRCHSINKKGGIVGPDLGGIGSRQTREYFLESILRPNKIITPGFESVTVALKNGTSTGGTVKSETPTELVLISSEDGVSTTNAVKKADIISRVPTLSPMPEGLEKLLTREDLRNLVEFLAGLRDGNKSAR